MRGALFVASKNKLGIIEFFQRQRKERKSRCSKRWLRTKVFVQAIPKSGKLIERQPAFLKINQPYTVMPVYTPFTQRFDQLPETLPVFPLANAVVLPGSHLPLNIFEPRYVNMVQDALRSHQLIGMIQPAVRGHTPELHNIGCAGRIVRFEETLDGRYIILLAGVCRFKISEEIDCTRGYRLVVPDWAMFEPDMQEQEPPPEEIYETFKLLAEKTLQDKRAGFDQELVAQMSAETVINGAVNYLPLSPEDKQILLETMALKDRAIAFIAILQGRDYADTTRH